MYLISPRGAHKSAGQALRENLPEAAFAGRRACPAGLLGPRSYITNGKQNQESGLHPGIFAVSRICFFYRNRGKLHRNGNNKVVGFSCRCVQAALPGGMD